MNVIGNWTIFYDWQCDGTYSRTSLNIKDDGTFSVGEGGDGVWAQAAGMLILRFIPSSTTYAGNVASKSITGIQHMGPIGRQTGCFYMLQAGAPTSVEPERLKTQPGVEGM